MRMVMVVFWAAAMHRVMVLDGRVVMHAGRMVLSGVSRLLNVRRLRRLVHTHSVRLSRLSESGRGRQPDYGQR